MREGALCAREGITLNIILLNSWNQTQEDVRFAYRLVESTRGRVFFTDKRGFQERLNLVRDRGLEGFCSWVLGAEDPEIWSLLPSHK